METFKPAWWCTGGHAQTIGGTLFRHSLPFQWTRKRLELPDGDFLDVDFLDCGSSNGVKAKPMVVILHAL